MWNGLRSALLCAVCAGCSSLSPSLPIGEFYTHVLDPLASQQADERIAHAKAELKAGQVSPALLALIGSAVGSPIVGSGLAFLSTASLDKHTAQLDAKRLPLKRELLAIYSSRTKTEGEHYTVCVDGAERVYAVQDGHFVRLADGPGPCEVTALTSLREQP